MSQNQTVNAVAHREESFKAKRLKWTIMIYLAGDNNLSANSIAIMKELEDANHRRDVRVLACFDSNTPRPKGARYLEINHRRFTNHTGMNWGLHNDLVSPEARGDHTVIAPDFCNCNPASTKPPAEPIAKEGLSRFIKFALENHPADRYMLILFGHGTAVAGNTFLADNNPPSFLRLRDFAEVLARHFDDRHKLDILACHNCVMNGIEAAYELKEEVNFMLGSQGLVLADGWPYRKIINAIEKDPSAPSKTISRKILKKCARALLDFSLMDRSSEQSLCDLRKFNSNNADIVKAVKNLATALKRGLEYDRCGHLCYPFVSDAVRLARLEAQSYWDETFVDLYDFCYLLVKKINDFMNVQGPMLFKFLQFLREERCKDKEIENFTELHTKTWLLEDTKLGKIINDISQSCKIVLDEVKKFVPLSYYVGPKLQYSHGLSIYFPWTLPEDPIIFDPTYPQSDDFFLKTAFDEYKEYSFVQDGISDWATFLESFFRATLRDVNRFDEKLRPSKPEDVERADFRIFIPEILPEDVAPPVDLSKSSPDVDREGDSISFNIKNYPRRFYVSPADCLRRCDLPRRDCPVSDDDREHCASYLGWNIRGIVAREIGLPESGPGHEPPHPLGGGSENEPST